jgi:hypothetical protein
MDLIILPSGSENADPEKTAWSLMGVADGDLNVVWLPDMASASAFRSENEWMMVLYDDEQVDVRLNAAIPVYLAAAFDVVVCLKRIWDTACSNGMRVFQSPRLFRNSARPDIYRLVPKNINELAWTRALDGWIESHGQTFR